MPLIHIITSDINIKN
jgi:hypothetical protein